MNIKRINNVEDVFMYFRRVIDNVEKLHRRAASTERTELAVHTKQALTGLNGILNFTAGTHKKMLEDMGAIKVPIKNKGRPDLKLVISNGPIEINFKDIK